MARLEGIAEQIDKRLDSIDRRLESMHGSLRGEIAETRDTLDSKITGLGESLSKKIDSVQWRMTSLILGTWISTMLAIFFHK